MEPQTLVFMLNMVNWYIFTKCRSSVVERVNTLVSIYSLILYIQGWFTGAFFFFFFFFFLNKKAKNPVKQIIVSPAVISWSCPSIFVSDSVLFVGGLSYLGRHNGCTYPILCAEQTIVCVCLCVCVCVYICTCITMCLYGSTLKMR